MVPINRICHYCGSGGRGERPPSYLYQVSIYYLSAPNLLVSAYLEEWIKLLKHLSVVVYTMLSFVSRSYWRDTVERQELLFLVPCATFCFSLFLLQGLSVSGTCACVRARMCMFVSAPSTGPLSQIYPTICSPLATLQVWPGPGGYLALNLPRWTLVCSRSHTCRGTNFFCVLFPALLAYTPAGCFQ